MSWGLRSTSGQVRANALAGPMRENESRDQDEEMNSEVSGHWSWLVSDPRQYLTSEQIVSLQGVLSQGHHVQLSGAPENGDEGALNASSRITYAARVLATGSAVLGPPLLLWASEAGEQIADAIGNKLIPECEPSYYFDQCEQIEEAKEQQLADMTTVALSLGTVSNIALGKLFSSSEVISKDFVDFVFLTGLSSINVIAGVTAGSCIYSHGSSRPNYVLESIAGPVISTVLLIGALTCVSSLALGGYGRSRVAVRRCALERQNRRENQEAAMATDDDSVNTSFRSILECPISFSHFRGETSAPVIASDGHVYEKQSLMNWLQQDRENLSSPETREKIIGFCETPIIKKMVDYLDGCEEGVMLEAGTYPEFAVSALSGKELSNPFVDVGTGSVVDGDEREDSRLYIPFFALKKMLQTVDESLVESKPASLLADHI